MLGGDVVKENGGFDEFYSDNRQMCTPVELKVVFIISIFFFISFKMAFFIAII